MKYQPTCAKMITHASVFSGIGGPEVAATMLGWTNLFHCEINEFGRKILDYHYPEAESYEDITKTDFTKWRGKINVLTGGFPCQPFSYAGKRGGAEDDRYLWPHMFRCIDEIRPDWVVAGNVAGILTMVEQGEISQMASAPSLFAEADDIQRYQQRSTFTLERICRDLETHGYSVQPILIPACGVGAPHRRDRVFIIAHTKGEPGERYGLEQRETCDEKQGEFGRGDSKGGGISSDTHSNRGRESLSNGGQLNVADTAKPGIEDLRQIRKNTISVLGNLADTSNPRLQEARTEQPTAAVRRNGIRNGEWFERLEGSGEDCGRWANFPTVSPVHRGNDGLPFNVDDLTISFSKWRTESLKAYGNAIVPQVMYEIFRAIEITYKPII